MALVTIDSQEKFDEITNLLKNTFTKIKPAWIGGVATGEKHEFVWISNGKKQTFTNWSPGEPSNRENEICQLTAWPPNLQMDDHICSMKRGVICEYSKDYHQQMNLHEKLQEELTKEAELKSELDRNTLLLKILLDYRVSHQINDGGNKMRRDLYMKKK